MYVFNKFLHWKKIYNGSCLMVRFTLVNAGTYFYSTQGHGVNCSYCLQQLTDLCNIMNGVCDLAADSCNMMTDDLNLFHSCHAY